MRYSQKERCTPPRVGTYVDDVFGGFPNCPSYTKAAEFREYLINKGKDLTVVFNMKTEKTPLPAQQQVILGCW